MSPLKDVTMNTDKTELFIQKYNMLPEGAKVKVDKIEGVKVFVSLAETEATV